MKSSYLVSLGMSAAMAMAVGACADEAAAPAMPEGEITARLTVTVSREAAQDPSSRLTHSENAAGLKAEWEQGDHLLFCYDTNDAGAVASTLTLESIDASDASVATFTGDVTIPASALAGGNTTLTRAAIAYLGKTAANAHRAIATSTTIDISTQDGRFDAMAWNDVMALRGLAVSVTPKGNNQYAATVADGSIIPLGQTENRKLAFAHFTTNLAGGSTVTITGNTYNAITLNISGSDTRTEGSITVTTWGRNAVRQPILASRITVPDGPGDHTGDAGTGGDDDDDDFVSGSGSASVTVRPVTHMFVALIPTDDAQPINFEAVEPDGTRLTYTLDARELTAGHFYRPDWDNAETEAENLNKGIFLKFEEVKDPEPSPADDTVGPTFTIKDRSGKDIPVRFTRANLHFNTTTREWYIPEKQTDFKGVFGSLLDNADTYSPAAGKEIVDLFRWGTTGYNDGSTIVCKPEYWRPSKYTEEGRMNAISASLPFYGEEDKNHDMTTLRSEDTKYADWGFVYSMQQLHTEDDYYTLTWNEFSGVLDTYVACMGTIGTGKNAINGIIIFDSTDYDATKQQLKDMGIATSAFKNMTSNYGNNHKTDCKWNAVVLPDYETLETLNAVFLPKAGRSIYTNSLTKTEACYWTATSSQHAASGFRACAESGNQQFNAYPNSMKSYAMSVRLVRKVTE